MLRAVTGNRQDVYPHQADRGQELFCPGCDAPVHVRRCVDRIDHFAHNPHAHCPLARPADIQAENIRWWLYTTVPDCRLEVILDLDSPDPLVADAVLTSRDGHQVAVLVVTRAWSAAKIRGLRDRLRDAGYAPLVLFDAQLVAPDDRGATRPFKGLRTVAWDTYGVVYTVDGNQLLRTRIPSKKGQHRGEQVWHTPLLPMRGWHADRGFRPHLDVTADGNATFLLVDPQGDVRPFTDRMARPVTVDIIRQPQPA